MSKYFSYLMIVFSFIIFPCATDSHFEVLQRPETLKGLLPYPAFVESVDSMAVIYFGTTFSGDFISVSRIAAQQINKLSGISLKPVLSSGFIVVVKNKEIPSEGYTLDVNKNGIKISASDSGGAYYAWQTLFQMIFAGKNGNKSILAGVSIKDQPAFAWRGMHLDVSRHYMPTEFIKKYIDVMAQYKMNVFHWHLVDSHGWRLEIKKYPELTERGAWRVDDSEQSWSWERFELYSEKNTQKKYGGFYTQEDVREIVKYASERNVTILPEIEMPGHSRAALTVYPEMTCSVAFDSTSSYSDVFCAGKESSYKFFEEVMDEVVELFPSKLIHIGGDEVGKDNWRKCPDCQQRIKTEGLKDEYELQSYFIKRIEKHLNSKGRNIIGWDEILDGGLSPYAAVMSWRGEKGGILAAKSKHNVVMAPTTYTYLDYSQNKGTYIPQGIGGYINLQKVYEWEPLLAELNDEDAKFVLGGQVQLWTEFMYGPQQVEYMAFPRALAAAEVLWSGKKKGSFENFKNRLNNIYPLLDAQNINFCFSGEINIFNTWATNINETNTQITNFIYPISDKLVGKQLAFYITADKGTPGDFIIERLFIAQDQNVIKEIDIPGRIGAFNRFNYIPFKMPTDGKTYTLEIHLRSLNEKPGFGRIFIVK